MTGNHALLQKGEGGHGRQKADHDTLQQSLLTFSGDLTNCTMNIKLCDAEHHLSWTTWVLLLLKYIVQPVFLLVYFRDLELRHICVCNQFSGFRCDSTGLSTLCITFCVIYKVSAVMLD